MGKVYNDYFNIDIFILFCVVFDKFYIVLCILTFIF